MNKFSILALGCLFLVSCSDDEPSNESGSGLNVIPSSVVDGVRGAGISAPYGDDLSVSYNSNGTINYFVVSELTYNFEYDDNDNSPKLKRIYTEYEEDGEFYSFESKNFKHNSSGFVTSYDIVAKYSDEYSSGTESINSKVKYNADGQAVSISASGTATYTEDGESYTEKGSYSIKYTYSGSNLTSATGDWGDGESSVANFKYDSNNVNTYNIFTPQMSVAMGQADPIAYILAYLGYLGNASKMLPVEMSTTDIGEGHTPDTETYDISYIYDDSNRVEEIKMTDDNGRVSKFQYEYYIFDVETE